MPRPHKGEKRSDFVSRAIKHFVEKEGLSQKEAVGRAHGYWKQYGKK